MTLSSTAERPLAFSGSANSESPERSSSRSNSSGIVPLLVEAVESRSALRHLSFPRVLGCWGWDATTFLFELERPDCQRFSFLRRQSCPLGRDCRCNMPQAFFAHRLSQDCVSLSEGIDAVNQVNIDRKSTRLNSSHLVISYAVFC